VEQPKTDNHVLLLKLLLLFILQVVAAPSFAQKLYPRDPNASYQSVNVAQNAAPIKAIIIHNYNTYAFKLKTSADGDKWNDASVPARDKKIFYFDKLYVKVPTTRKLSKTFELSTGSYDLRWDEGKRLWILE
jgi:hypothetical protein